MSLRALVGSIALAVGLAPVLTGCGSDGGDADDVPTITTRPSTPDSATSTADTATSAPNTATSAANTATSAPNSATSSESEPPPTETAGPSPEPPTDAPGGPTSYGAAANRIQRVGAAPSGEVVATDRFSTPGDVVYCLLDDAVIGPTCELRTGFIQDDEVCGGAAEGVGRIETFEGRARPVCNSDTIREPGSVVVDAPAVVANGKITCAVESIGVTCTDDDARTGFFLGPREYHVF